MAGWRTRNIYPRFPLGRTRPPDFPLYADASSSTKLIDAPLFKGSTKPPLVLEMNTSRVHEYWGNRLGRKNAISGLEMLAPIDFSGENRRQLDGRLINLNIANNSVIASMVRGDSGTDMVAATISLFWQISESFAIDIWLRRVSSKRNSAVLPTRHAPIPVKFEKRMDFSQLCELLQLTLNWGDLVVA